MVEDKKVSIIICFYNEEKYLEKAIDSVLAQTYQNFELIMINDGSTDGSDRIVRTYSDQRIIYKCNPKNMRQAYCRNRGLDLATGDYIGFFDGDDIMLPDKLEIQVKYLKEHEDVTLVSGSYCYMDMHGNVDQKTVYPEYKSDEEIRAYILFGNCIASAGGALFRREVIEKNDIRFDERNVASEDYLFWVDMMPYAKFANVNECFFYYRVNHGSKSTCIVNSDRDAYNAEIKGLLKHAWEERGIILADEDFSFLQHFLYMYKKIWKPADICQGIRVYLKIKKQLKELKLPEGRLILRYYKKKWMQAYSFYWAVKKVIGIVR